MLTTHRMDRLLIDLTLDNPVEPKTKEEREFVAAAKSEVEQIERQGMIVALPPEWQV